MNLKLNYVRSVLFTLPIVLFILSVGTCHAGELSSAMRDQLLAQRAGFGSHVTGGYSGPTVHVTSNADSGHGSLREALTGDEPAWIVFDGDYVIRLKKGIQVGSHKTIDGRGSKVILTGHGQYGLLINSVANVIVENIIFRDFGDVAKTKSNDPYDAINLGGGKRGTPTDRVWIDHCDLSKAGDKLIGIAGGATHITVSWNHFHDQEQVFQIGAMATQDKDVVTTITVHHNYFSNTQYRHPVISYGKLHAYNNYFREWKLYGIRSERIAQSYLQNNIFQAGDNKRATLIRPAGKGRNDARTLQDTRLGYLKSVGDLKLNGAKIKTNEPEKVFDPSFYYIDEIERATEALAIRIAKQAGWQPADFFFIDTLSNNISTQ